MFSWLNKKKKPLADYEVNKTYYFNDPVKKGFVNNQTIPDDIFDLNIAVNYFKPKNKPVVVFVISSKKEIK